MSMNKTLSFFPSLDEEEIKKKQGIVAILGEERTRNAASIRRTLSADMSSRRWLKDNGFFSLVKRNPNSYGSDSSSSSSESEEEWERSPSVEDVWKNIVQKGKPEKTENCSSMTLITQKSENSVLPAPYLHPLAKQSARYMSDNSLQMCTEPLGSETGADCCLSCYSCSRVFNGVGDRGRVRGGKQSSHLVHKKSPAPPPPLTSVSGADGTTLCIQSRRENGRLVIEAVSQPPRNRFITERRDGRLVLSLPRAAPAEAVVEGDDGGEDDGSAAEKKGAAFVVSENLNAVTSGIHKLVAKRLVTSGNKNPKLMTDTNNKKLLITQSLPSPPRVAALLIPQPPSRAPSFNAYEYFWRSKGGGGGAAATPTTLKRSHNIRTIKCNENQKLDSVAVKGIGGDYFLPYLKGCKETRKSILFWEADCIPTS